MIECRISMGSSETFFHDELNGENSKELNNLIKDAVKYKKMSIEKFSLSNDIFNRFLVNCNTKKKLIDGIFAFKKHFD